MTHLFEQTLSDGSLVEIETYKYDVRGNQIENYYYHVELINNHYEYPLTSIEYRSYDNMNNVIKQVNFDSKGILTGTQIYKYDKYNNIIDEKRSNATGSMGYRSTTMFEYDKYGNWIKQTTFTDAVPTSYKEREIEYYYR